MSKELIAATERELQDWPGTNMTQDQQGTHGKIVLHFSGQSRLVVISCTPSDHRAVPNHLAVVRRELRNMGAQKAHVVVGKPKAERPIKAFKPVTQAPFKELELTMKPSNKIEAIFVSISDLRYGEMLDFAEILAGAAIELKLRRSVAADWANMLQAVIERDGVKA
jgi:hypothetical protein